MNISKFKILPYKLKALCWYNEDTFIAYSKGKIYMCRIVFDNLNIKLEKDLLFKLPFYGLSKILYVFRFFERLCRYEPAYANILDNELLLSHNGRIYSYSLVKKILKIEIEFRDGMRNALNLTTLYNTESKYDIIFGEYFSNVNTEPVLIYGRNKTTKKWQIAYEFESGKIRHIHNIIFDKLHKTLIILTGDSNTESGIWIADLDLLNIDSVLIGQQKYRSCFLSPLDNHFLYVTDTQEIKNSLNIIDRYTLELSQSDSIEGSVIYGLDIDKYAYISTVFEQNPSILGIKKYIKDYLSEGIVARKFYLYLIDKNSFEIKKLMGFTKDWYPSILFQFGTAKFCQGKNDKYVLCSILGAKEFDGKTILIERADYENT